MKKYLGTIAFTPQFCDIMGTVYSVVSYKYYNFSRRYLHELLTGTPNIQTLPEERKTLCDIFLVLYTGITLHNWIVG